MAKTIYKGIPNHPGRGEVPGSERSLHVHPGQKQDAFMPGNLVALGTETVVLMDINFTSPYLSAWYTETKDGS